MSDRGTRCNNLAYARAPRVAAAPKTDRQRPKSVGLANFSIASTGRSTARNGKITKEVTGPIIARARNCLWATMKRTPGNRLGLARRIAFLRLLGTVEINRTKQNKKLAALT